jgi:hypothetical protein
MTNPEETRDFISLKWGTLKAWDLKTEKCVELLRKWHEIGASASAMMHHDTPEQKALICQMIDECNADTIHMDWEDIEIPKGEAKKYVMEYEL